MNKNLSALMLASALATPTLFSAPVQTKDVAANPALLAYVDCDTLRDSSIGKAILTEPETQDKLAAFAALFSFDLRTQLHGLTIYTTEDHPKDGVLIVYADFDPERVKALVKIADGYKLITNGSHVMASWIDDKKKNKEGEHPRIYAAITGNRIVFGQNDSRLAEALDVIDGKSASYAGKNEIPQPEPGETILAAGAILKFNFGDGNPNAAIFKMSKSVQFKVGEGGGHVTAYSHFEAADNDTATQIAAIANGLLAVIKLQRGDNGALELAKSVTIKQNASSVDVTLSLPSDELMEKWKEAKTKKADAATSNK